MSLFTAKRLAAIQHRHRNGHRFRVFVETGTYEGKTARMAREHLPVVHTIEKDPVLHAAAAQRHADTDIIFHLGDTLDVLPRLAVELQEPCIFYLDAHYWPARPETAGAEAPLPLFAELDILGARAWHDIIIIDDVRSFGRVPGWENATRATLAARIPRREFVVLHDQAVLYR